ncbi:hypothetical protein MTP99_011434 [Tenebrio molitor]|jgi:hypothetical protein|nr:hypothetical protein MTP99_011434 [Tenebrio molitor]
MASTFADRNLTWSCICRSGPSYAKIITSLEHGEVPTECAIAEPLGCTKQPPCGAGLSGRRIDDGSVGSWPYNLEPRDAITDK